MFRPFQHLKTQRKKLIILDSDVGIAVIFFLSDIFINPYVVVLPVHLLLSPSIIISSNSLFSAWFLKDMRPSGRHRARARLHPERDINAKEIYLKLQPHTGIISYRARARIELEYFMTITLKILIHVNWNICRRNWLRTQNKLRGASVILQHNIFLAEADAIGRYKCLFTSFSEAADGKHYTSCQHNLRPVTESNFSFSYASDFQPIL